MSIANQLEGLGWEFMPISDTEWSWRKFDYRGKQIAVQGDETWMKDCYRARIIDTEEKQNGQI